MTTSGDSVPTVDAYAPPQIAERVRALGVTKATAPRGRTFALAVLAGAFISLGAVFYTVTVAGAPSMAFGFGRLVGGIAFSLGLILVIVGGAELFTGNNLLAMAWAARCVPTRAVLENWGVVYAGNFVGALGTVGLVLLAGTNELGQGTVGDQAVRIAQAKVSLGVVEAFARGILCNVLVCLAVWLCMGARSVTDKVMAIVFPISAFVACGFEHSIANMYFLPVGWALTNGQSTAIGGGAVVANLAVVTLGNIVGGTLLVALVYWFVYLREGKADS